jgi:hypothetical protein
MTHCDGSFSLRPKSLPVVQDTTMTFIFINVLLPNLHHFFSSFGVYYLFHPRIMRPSTFTLPSFLLIIGTFFLLVSPSKGQYTRDFLGLHVYTFAWDYITHLSIRDYHLLPYLGYRTRYFLFGTMHPTFFIRAYVPSINCSVFTHRQPAWVYHPLFFV